MKSGRSVSTPLFSAKMLADSVDTHKFAFVMSKKESKTAISRNRAKRRIRAAMRKILPGANKPFYCIIHIKKSVLTASFDDIVLNLRRALSSFITS